MWEREPPPEYLEQEIIMRHAKRLDGYDPRLNSEDVVIRQQAEIEALRTALVAANSDSNGEYDRLRRQLDMAEASHAGQLRNTAAFKAERDQAYELLRRVDHTLTAHGQLHASTPLHDAIQLLLPEGWV